MNYMVMREGPDQQEKISQKMGLGDDGRGLEEEQAGLEGLCWIC